DLDEEEHEMLRLIRDLTIHSVKPLNQQMLEWTTGNSLRLLPERVPALPRLKGLTRELRLHLELWMGRYETVLLPSERHSVVYLDDLKMPGVAFPSGIAESVGEALNQMR